MKSVFAALLSASSQHCDEMIDIYILSKALINTHTAVASQFIIQLLPLSQQIICAFVPSDGIHSIASNCTAIAAIY